MTTIRLNKRQHDLLKMVKQKLLRKGTRSLPPELQKYAADQEMRTWILPDVVELGLIALLNNLGG